MSIQDHDNIPPSSSTPMAPADEKSPSHKVETDEKSPLRKTETDLKVETDDSPKIKLCGVCHENEPKYKCPRCLLPYCSLTCSTTHKPFHANDPPPSPPKPSPAPPAPPSRRAGTTGYKGPFSGLEHSIELRRLFATYPRLRERLDAILSVTQPPEVGRRGREAWTPDGGMEMGVRELRRAREGVDGEGVREFERLVLGMVGGKGEGGWKEEVEESVKVVERLLRGEM